MIRIIAFLGGLGFVAALLVGVVDTLGRVLLTPALGSMAIFVMMAAILPFPASRVFWGSDGYRLHAGAS